jgi:hypothetical protein
MYRSNHWDSVDSLIWTRRRNMPLMFCSCVTVCVQEMYTAMSGTNRSCCWQYLTSNIYMFWDALNAFFMNLLRPRHGAYCAFLLRGMTVEETHLDWNSSCSSNINILSELPRLKWGSFYLHCPERHKRTVGYCSGDKTLRSHCWVFGFSSSRLHVRPVVPKWEHSRISTEFFQFSHYIDSR